MLLCSVPAGAADIKGKAKVDESAPAEAATNGVESEAGGNDSAEGDNSAEAAAEEDESADSSGAESDADEDADEEMDEEEEQDQEQVHFICII